MADERVGNPPPKVVGESDGRLLWRCTFCVCGRSALLGHLYGVSRSIECDFLSVLSTYPIIFCSALFVSSLIRDMLLCFKYFYCMFKCSCVLVALV